jgi:hypothetical protein
LQIALLVDFDFAIDTAVFKVRCAVEVERCEGCHAAALNSA